MTEEDKKTIISLFAHPDDELGAVGTLANHAKRGDEVVMIWTTYGELTTKFPEMSPKEIQEERSRHGDEIAKIVGGQAEFLDLGDSFVEDSRDHRIKVAQAYVKHKPNAIVTWGLGNMHSDHRNTGRLAIDAIKYARINQIMNVGETHRKNVILLSYFEKASAHKIKYIDVSDSMEEVKNAANFYAEIYDWKNVEDWVVNRRRNSGMESHSKYAEKFNLQFDFSKPSKFII